MLPNSSRASMTNDDVRSKKPAVRPSWPATPAASTAVQFAADTAFGRTSAEKGARPSTDATPPRETAPDA